MGKHKNSIVNIPIDELQKLLREQFKSETATIIEFNSMPMKHNGHSGHDIFQMRILWKDADAQFSLDWVIKNWHPRGLMSELMGIVLPIEILAWNHELINHRMLPNGVNVPIIGTIVNEDDGTFWIVMEDISNEIKVFPSTSNEEHLEQGRFILDKLSRLHIQWEQSQNQPLLKECSWLIKQETRLCFGADFYSKCLEQTPVNFDRVTKEWLFCYEGTQVFWDWLPERDRHVWKKHLYNREALVEACSNLPQTLLHGDLDDRNIGLRWQTDNQEMFLIDWEWIGVGSTAFDVRQFIESLIGLHNLGNESQLLSDCYFDCYQANGGVLMNRSSWERAYDLALIYEGFKTFPFIAGASLDWRTSFFRFNEETIKNRVAQITKAINKWLC